jgi:hypothetical protein
MVGQMGQIMGNWENLGQHTAAYWKQNLFGKNKKKIKK